MRTQNLLRLVAGLSVPSPLVGEGQGGGRHTARSLVLSGDDSHLRLLKKRFHQTPFPGLPLSPALPHKGGGSALCLPRDRGIQLKQVGRCLA